jgi:hypothetical protein
LYYKARYYDPGLGRFLQADDLLFPDSSQGMNRLMYEEGNPITYSDPTGQFLSGNIFDNLVKELTSFTMRSVGQNLAKAVQRATFLNKTRVDALLFKRENYYTKSDMVRGYRSLGDQYIGYIKDPVKAIERSDLARSDLGRLYTNFYRGYINLIDQYIFYNKFPKYAIENSDLARSKIGKKFTQAWKESSDARVFAGITDFPDGGFFYGTIGKILGLPIIGKIAGVYGLVTGIQFIIRACSGNSDTYCDVSGR